MRAMSLFLALVALAPVGASAAPPANPGDAPTLEARRERHRELRERVGQRLKTMRTVELANALSLDEAAALKLSAEMGRFDERREPLREKLREARWTVIDAARGDAAAAKRLDAALADATESRKALASLDLEEYRALAKMVPADQQPLLARFLLQFPQRVQRIVHEARAGMGPGPGPRDGTGPGRGMGPGRRGAGRGLGPGPGAGPGDEDLDDPFVP